MLELDRTKVVLENATNNLMALQHKQFVENRVYDDDETLANIDNVPVTDIEQTDKVFTLTFTSTFSLPLAFPFPFNLINIDSLYHSLVCGVFISLLFSQILVQLM